MKPYEVKEYWQNEKAMGDFDPSYVEVLDSTIELADLRTPMKAIRPEYPSKTFTWICPRCKMTKHTPKTTFCGECGQALDFSDFTEEYVKSELVVKVLVKTDDGIVHKGFIDFDPNVDLFASLCEYFGNIPLKGFLGIKGCIVRKDLIQSLDYEVVDAKSI